MQLESLDKKDNNNNNNKTKEKRVPAALGDKQATATSFGGETTRKVRGRVLARRRHLAAFDLGVKNPVKKTR